MQKHRKALCALHQVSSRALSYTTTPTSSKPEYGHWHPTSHGPVSWPPRSRHRPAPLEHTATHCPHHSSPSDHSELHLNNVGILRTVCKWTTLQGPLETDFFTHPKPLRSVSLPHCCYFSTPSSISQYSCNTLFNHLPPKGQLGGFVFDYYKCTTTYVKVFVQT